MNKCLKEKLNRIALTVLGVLFISLPIFGVRGGVLAAAETEVVDTAIIRVKGGL